jgi:hypothetical protein
VQPDHGSMGYYPEGNPAPKSEQKGEPKSSEPPFFGNDPMQGQLVRRLPALGCPQDEPGGSGATAGSHLPMYDSNCR